MSYRASDVQLSVLAHRHVRPGITDAAFYFETCVRRRHFRSRRASPVYTLSEIMTRIFQLSSHHYSRRQSSSERSRADGRGAVQTPALLSKLSSITCNNAHPVLQHNSRQYIHKLVYLIFSFRSRVKFRIVYYTTNTVVLHYLKKHASLII